MIKKLVKYGNSQALVLDKALLEILNISDATKLKLSTDGMSLTITPLHETSEPTEKPASSISTTESEAEMHYGALQAEKQKESMKSLLENAEKNQLIHKEFKAISDEFNKKYKYGQRMMELTSSQHYKDSMKKIATEAYKKNLSLEEYNDEVARFIHKAIPETKEIQEKYKALEKKYETIDYKKQVSENEKLSPEMKSAAENLKKCQEAYLKLLEQPELFQQMAWEQKQMMDEFDKKYNYTQKLTEVMFNPDYKEAIEKLSQEAIDENWAPLVHAKKMNDLIQSFMPEIPLHELTEATREFESRYEALRNMLKHEALEETKN